MEVVELGTKREVFERVRDHLLSQGERCMIGKDCMYRGENGLMCAIGCLIPDDLYHEGMEYESPFSLWDEKQLHFVISDMPQTESALSFLGDLQVLHDDIEPSRWRDALALFEEERFGGS